MSTRVILPTPCRNPNGTDRQPCDGQVDWEDHGRRRLGTCDECGHEYAGRTPVYDQAEPAPLRRANTRPEMPPPPEEPTDFPDNVRRLETGR